MLNVEQLEHLRRVETTPNRVGTAMALTGVTQIELAAAIGLTQGYVSRIKNGQYGPELPGETMRAFAEFFGCAIEDLFPKAAA